MAETIQNVRIVEKRYNMTKKILRAIDDTSFLFFMLMIAAINERSDLKVVCLLMIFPVAWLLIRDKFFHAFNEYEY